MFIQPADNELADFDAQWTVINTPGFQADPNLDGTRQVIFNLKFFRQVHYYRRYRLYRRDKERDFSALNFILPYQRMFLSMHCSANVGDDGTPPYFLAYLALEKLL